MKTIKSVYKIGNGPSSSHTVGPYHAAQIFGKRYPDSFLCESAAADACAPGNPRPATLEDFEAMFRKLM